MWLQIALDVIGIGFAAAAGPVWKGGEYRSRKPQISPVLRLLWSRSLICFIVLTETSIITEETAKDLSNAIVLGGLQIVKDIIKPADDINDATLQLQHMVLNLQVAWQWFNEHALNTIFLGNPGDETLTLAMSDGALVYAPPVSSDDATNSALLAFTTMLIPYAWALSNDGHHPFLMYVVATKVFCSIASSGLGPEL